MRTPFQVPSGCPEIEVDIDFLGSLPFCSVPSFPEPTFAPHVIPQLTPDIAPPDPCQCLSFAVTGIERMATQPGISMHVSRMSDDCCEGVHQISLFLDVPCMPLSVAAHGAITMPPDMTAAAATARMSLRRSDVSHCGLSINLDIEVPCIPFAIDTTGIVSMKDVTAAQFAMGFSAKAGSCVMLGTLDLDLPCVPFSLADGGAVAGTVSVLDDPATEPEFTLNLGLAKNGCQLGLAGNFALRLGAGQCVKGDADIEDSMYKSIEVYSAQ